jgi:hypothetical protein
MKPGSLYRTVFLPNPVVVTSMHFEKVYLKKQPALSKLLSSGLAFIPFRPSTL